MGSRSAAKSVQKNALPMHTISQTSYSSHKKHLSKPSMHSVINGSGEYPNTSQVLIEESGIKVKE